MKQIIRLIIISFLIVSCTPKSTEYGPNMMSCLKTPKKETSNTLKTDHAVVKKKIIKDGKLGIKVSNPFSYG